MGVKRLSVRSLRYAERDHDPYEVFSWLRREDRKEYVALMRNTMLIKHRNLGRANRKVMHQLKLQAKQDAMPLTTLLTKLLSKVKH